MIIRDYFETEAKAWDFYNKLKAAKIRRAKPKMARPARGFAPGWGVKYQTDTCFYCGEKLRVTENAIGMGPQCEYMMTCTHDGIEGKGIEYNGRIQCYGGGQEVIDY